MMIIVKNLHIHICPLIVNLDTKFGLRKLTPRNVTAGMLSRNFKETVKQFIASDEAFSFKNTTKGTPAY